MILIQFIGFNKIGFNQIFLIDCGNTGLGLEPIRPMTMRSRKRNVLSLLFICD